MLAARQFSRYPWSVVDELLSMQDDFNDLLDGRQHAYPPINAWYSGDGLVVDVLVPGVDPKDVEIEVKGDVLTITGKRQLEDAPADQYIIRERERGDFSRKLRLPHRVESGKVNAAYKNGILRVTLPRAEQDKPRRIAIEAET